MKILRFNWQAYDPIGGMKYATGVVVIIALFYDLPRLSLVRHGLECGLSLADHNHSGSSW
ncbi:MAG: hypothetical protein GQ541_08940 [Desulfovibrionaceae bacterium]|nr:hypothetical protein [Desulfovibrionaceae bacterium]